MSQRLPKADDPLGASHYMTILHFKYNLRQHVYHKYFTWDGWHVWEIPVSSENKYYCYGQM